MRRALAAAAACLLMAGCGDRGTPTEDSSIRVEQVRVPGRADPVPCILWDASGSGGLAMSCDWS